MQHHQLWMVFKHLRLSGTRETGEAGFESRRDLDLSLEDQEHWVMC